MIDFNKPNEHTISRCPMCDGRGMVTIIDMEEKESITHCPACNGNGTIQERS